MHLKIITIYCLCADFLVAYGYKDDPQARLSTAEVMTVALVAAAFFHGNQETSRVFLAEHGYIPAMLSKSRFNRRLHAIPEVVWQALFWLLGEIAKQTNPEGIYIVDSLPVPVCDNIRIKRCRLYRGQEHRGYCASKRRYYWGFKVHLLITATGKPVEMVLTPASLHDLDGFKQLPLALPEDAEIEADTAYNDYGFEEGLHQIAGIALVAQRRCNSKRPHPGYVTYLCQHYRKRVETTFSGVTNWFSRTYMR